MGIILNKNTGVMQTGFHNENQMLEHGFLPNEYVFFEDESDITEDYKAKIRINAIKSELEQENSIYEKVVSTPVEYKNGFKYKPSYADGYAMLIASGIFPLVIWDSSELNPVEMVEEELVELASFLKDIAEPAFQKRKENRKKLLEELNALAC